MIPKIIHQLWIGPKPAPTHFMDSWRLKNPDFEYIRWTEAELEERGMQLRCTKEIDSMCEINGKADIIRWEILAKYGGVFVDADSICIEPLDESVMQYKAFASYESEEVRKGLVATCAMGFYPNHSLCQDAVEWILHNEISVEKTGRRAWQTVGPGLLTRLIQTQKYTDFTLLPSYYFIPTHFAGTKYTAHGKVYASQEWGSTRQNYDIMNTIELADAFREPKQWVSVLIPSFNTKHVYVAECLQSMKNQEGHFGMEIVWVNDGSDPLNTQLLERELNKFQKTTRFVKVVYHNMEKNRGISACLNAGLQLCSHDLVLRMDSDDIMVVQRIQTQIDFMESHPEAVLCGSNVQLFELSKGVKNILQTTRHPAVLTWEEYQKKPSHWFMNHPTLCFRKKDILAIGGYDETIETWEDLHLEIRLLKQHGVLYNIETPLVFYRIHENQVTYQGIKMTPEVIEQRVQYIADMCQPAKEPVCPPLDLSRVKYPR